MSPGAQRGRDGWARRLVASLCLLGFVPGCGDCGAKASKTPRELTLEGARSLEEAGHHDAAAQAYAALLARSPEADPPPPDSEAPPSEVAPTPPLSGAALRKALHLGLSRSLRATGDTRGALEARLAALKIPPTSPFEFLGAADLHAALGDGAAALGTVELGLVTFPGQVDLMARRAVLLATLGRGDAALAEIRAAREEDPTHLGAAYGEIDILQALGRLDAAEAALDALGEVAAGEPETLLRRGRVAQARGDLDAAHRHVQAGLKAAGDCTCTEEVRDALKTLAIEMGAGGL